MTVNGLVQGVGFRYMTLILANELKIKGKVQNMPDGSVYIEAQSDDTDALSRFIEGIKNSPTPAGRVDSFSIASMQPKSYTRFNVVYADKG